MVSKAEGCRQLGGSHHKSISIEVVLPVGENASKQEVPNYSKADFESIKLELGEINWEEKFREKGT